MYNVFGKMTAEQWEDQNRREREWNALPHSDKEERWAKAIHRRIQENCSHIEETLRQGKRIMVNEYGQLIQYH